MSNDDSTVVRFFVLSVLGTATAGMIAVSIRANFLFGYGLGQTEDKALVFGWANVATDIWKVLGLILISTLWRRRQLIFAIVLLPIWSLCVLWGMLGAIGIYAQDRETFISKRADYADMRTAKQRQLAEIDRKLSTAPARTVAQVDAAIAAVFARPIRNRQQIIVGTVGSISQNCARQDRKSVDACLEVALLKQERVAAEDAAHQQQTKRDLEVTLSVDRDAVGYSVSADTSAEFISWLTVGRVQLGDISFGFPLAFALLIELISALGPSAVVEYAERSRQTTRTSSAQDERDTARRCAPKPALACLDGVSIVANWLADRTEPASDRSVVQLEQLYLDYANWCNARGIQPMGVSRFELLFDRLRFEEQIGGAIQKVQHDYRGLRICDPSLSQREVSDRATATLT